MSPSLPHASSLKLNELVRQLLVSQSRMVRSVKVTLPSASMRITVLVLEGEKMYRYGFTSNLEQRLRDGT